MCSLSRRGSIRERTLLETIRSSLRANCITISSSWTWYTETLALSEVPHLSMVRFTCAYDAMPNGGDVRDIVYYWLRATCCDLDKCHYRTVRVRTFSVRILGQCDSSRSALVSKSSSTRTVEQLKKAFIIVVRYQYLLQVRRLLTCYVSKASNGLR